MRRIPLSPTSPPDALDPPVTVRSHVPLATRTSFRVGGEARWFAEPRGLDELVEVLRWRAATGVGHFVLGGGTNTLIGDRGYPGLVLSTRALTTVQDAGRTRIACGPGALLRRVVLFANDRSWRGLERLVGIPGTIGGAVFGNAGGHGASMADSVESILLCDPGGDLRRLDAAGIDWSYRSSGLSPGEVIAEVVLRLEPGRARELARTSREVFARKHESQPLSAASAGCVFRNPPGEAAARLVERAGLKGVRIGGAVVSGHHANFIVNEGGATAADVEALIQHVRREVQLRFGVLLEREIVSPPGPDGELR